MTTRKRLDDKLARIQADPAGCRDFMLCDAKDADMAFGIPTPGPDPAQPGRYKSRARFLEQIRAIVAQDQVDVMLASVHTLEQLVVGERRFAESAMTTAIRANDTTDIWVGRHAGYAAQPSRPFRSANLAAVMRAGIADLGLYSITFNNDLEADLRSLEAYRAFRAEAGPLGFRHFLEVFNPNAPSGLSPEAVPEYVNDCIVRALAGLTRAERPLFLKVAYNGPGALEDLVAYDERLPIGILGGGGGTAHDTFKLLHDAKKHGARLALFGRKINLAEDPLALIGLMQRVIAGELKPAEAVRTYHAALADGGIAPRRSLEDDLLITEPVLHDKG